MTVHEIKPNNEIFNLAAEQAVIGAMFLKGRAYDLVAPIIRPSSFYQERHRYIFDAVKILAMKGISRDIVTVAEEMKRMGTLEACGGVGYLTVLAQETPSAANVEAYARIVDEKCKRRCLLGVADEIAMLAQSDREISEIVDEASRAVSSVAIQQQKTMKPLSGSLDEFVEILTQRSERGMAGLDTGFVEINRITSGFRAGDLVVVAGRPGTGKTTFALNVARHVARKNAVLFISLEMPATQLLERVVSDIGSIPNRKMKTGVFSKAESDSLTAASLEAKQLNFIVDDTSTLTGTEAASKAREFKRNNPDAGLVVIDYLGLMEATGDTKAEALGSITRQLKIVAKELEMPIILLAQFNRDLAKRSDKYPVMSDLRDSGAIEQDADIIIGMYREAALDLNYKNQEEAKACVIKNRHGETEDIPLRFRGEYFRFENER